jgi:hypothetical protein
VDGTDDATAKRDVARVTRTIGIAIGAMGLEREMSSNVLGLVVFALVLVALEGGLHLGARVAARRGQIDGVTADEAAVRPPAPVFSDADADAA